MRMRILGFWTDETGVTALEYALIASLVSVATVTVLMSLGGSLTSNYQNVGAALPK